MTKLKIRKSIVKRFKITPTGKVIRRVQTSRHLRRRKSRKQVRRFKVPVRVTGKMAIKIKRMLGKG